MALTTTAMQFLGPVSLRLCEQSLANWLEGRAFEKLFAAEEVIHFLTNREKWPIDGYEWVPGTDDLSLAAGRANWAFARLLGLRLPPVTAASSSEELEKLRVEASRLLEAYRNGLIAAARDHEVSPERLAALRLRYQAKIAFDQPQDGYESLVAFDSLLSEWPPIGRRLDELAIIVGKRPENAERRARGTVSYTIQAGPGGAVFYFTVRDGIIWLVRRASIH